MYNTFKVLTTHADTSDVVLDTTLKNVSLQSASRVCKQDIDGTKSLDTGNKKPDPACVVDSTGPQISNACIRVTSVIDNESEPNILTDTFQAPCLLNSHNEDSVEVFSQPSTVDSNHLIDVKANARSQCPYSGFEIYIYNNRHQWDLLFLFYFSTSFVTILKASLVTCICISR